MPGVLNLPLSRGPECHSKFSWMMGNNLSEGSDLVLLALGLSRKRVLLVLTVGRY